MESDEDELPNAADLLRPKKPTNRKLTLRTPSGTSIEGQNPSLPQKILKNGASEDDSGKIVNTSKPAKRRQRPLKRVENNSILLQPLKVSSDISILDEEEKKRPQKSASRLKTRDSEERKDVAEENSCAKERCPESDEENTLDDIEFWSRPRPLRSPPQTRPPLETPRAARTKARSFKMPPPLKESLSGPQEFHPTKSTSAIPISRPTSSDNDHAAILT
jgi:hypothetical protein